MYATQKVSRTQKGMLSKVFGCSLPSQQIRMNLQLWLLWERSLWQQKWPLSTCMLQHAKLTHPWHYLCNILPMQQDTVGLHMHTRYMEFATRVGDKQETDEPGWEVWPSPPMQETCAHKIQSTLVVHKSQGAEMADFWLQCSGFLLYSIDHAISAPWPNKQLQTSFAYNCLTEPTPGLKTCHNPHQRSTCSVAEVSSKRSVRVGE